MKETYLMIVVICNWSILYFKFSQLLTEHYPVISEKAITYLSLSSQHLNVKNVSFVKKKGIPRRFIKNLSYKLNTYSQQRH